MSPWHHLDPIHSRAYAPVQKRQPEPPFAMHACGLAPEGQLEKVKYYARIASTATSHLAADAGYRVCPAQSNSASPEHLLFGYCCNGWWVHPAQTTS